MPGHPVAHHHRCQRKGSGFCRAQPSTCYSGLNVQQVLLWPDAAHSKQQSSDRPRQAALQRHQVGSWQCVMYIFCWRLLPASWHTLATDWILNSKMRCQGLQQSLPAHSVVSGRPAHYRVTLALPKRFCAPPACHGAATVWPGPSADANLRTSTATPMQQTRCWLSRAWTSPCTSTGEGLPQADGYP